MDASSQTPEDTNASHGEDIRTEVVIIMSGLKTQSENEQRKIDELEEPLKKIRITQPEDEASMSRLKATLKTANGENHSLSHKSESTERDFVRFRGESNIAIGEQRTELEIPRTANREADRPRRAHDRHITSLRKERRASKAVRITPQTTFSEKTEMRLQGELRERDKKHEKYVRKVAQQHSEADKDAEGRHQGEIQERDRRHIEHCPKQEQQHSKAGKDVERVLRGCIGDLEAQKRDLKDQLKVQINANHGLESKFVLAQEQMFKKIDESIFLGDSDPTIISLFRSLSGSIHLFAKAHSISVWPREDDTNSIKELENALKDVVLLDDLGGHTIFPHDLFRRTKNVAVLCVSASLANMVCIKILKDPFWFFQAREQMMEIYENLEKVDLFQAQIWRSQLLRVVQKIEKAGIQNPLAQLRQPATQQMAQDFLDSAPARYLLRPLVQNTNADALNREVQYIFEAASDLGLRLSCNRAKVELFPNVYTVNQRFPFRFGSEHVEGHLYHKLNYDTYGNDKRLTRFDERMAKILIFPIVGASGDEDGQGYNENYRIWSKGIYWMDERN